MGLLRAWVSSRSFSSRGGVECEVIIRKKTRPVTKEKETAVLEGSYNDLIHLEERTSGDEIKPMGLTAREDGEYTCDKT